MDPIEVHPLHTRSVIKRLRANPKAWRSYGSFMYGRHAPQGDVRAGSDAVIAELKRIGLEFDESGTAPDGKPLEYRWRYDEWKEKQFYI